MPASRMRQTRTRLLSAMVSTSPGADRWSGLVGALGVDADGAGLDQLLRQGARFDGAGEEQPRSSRWRSAPPSLMGGPAAGARQASLALALLQDGERGEGRIRIERLSRGRALLDARAGACRRLSAGSRRSLRSCARRAARFARDAVCRGACRARRALRSCAGFGARIGTRHARLCRRGAPSALGRRLGRWRRRFGDGVAALVAAAGRRTRPPGNQISSNSRLGRCDGRLRRGGAAGVGRSAGSLAGFGRSAAASALPAAVDDGESALVGLSASAATRLVGSDGLARRGRDSSASAPSSVRRSARSASASVVSGAPALRAAAERAARGSRARSGSRRSLRPRSRAARSSRR